MIKILIVDDEKKILNILDSVLSEAGFITKTASSGQDAIIHAQTFKPDILLSDLKMPDLDGIETMSEISKNLPHLKTIIMTAHASIETAIKAMKQGAYDYITKPFDNEELLLIIKKAIEVKKLGDEVRMLKEELAKDYTFNDIIGQSSAMDSVFKMAKKVAKVDTTVLVMGESGTGKELIARAIHYSSDRKNGPFIAVNCGAIPQNLIESEFFGHEKGSFTGAFATKSGKFEQANNGTIFLDEIGEMPKEAQVRLLRVLQEFEVTKIGGKDPIKINTRVIAATNKDLDEEVRIGNFREDLYWRLTSFSIILPPLRNRKEDIPLLVDHFVIKYNKKLSANIDEVRPDFLKCLVNYDWPGNIRELENIISQSLILTESNVLTQEFLPPRIKGLKESCAKSKQKKNIEKQDQDKELILNKLKENLGSRTKTAEDLGISRKTLFNKMQKYDIK
ncbi:MAG: sigma-54 dependent transcriptional regulator [Pseudomonadota bacterium]